MIRIYLTNEEEIRKLPCLCEKLLKETEPEAIRSSEMSQSSKTLARVLHNNLKILQEQLDSCEATFKIGYMVILSEGLSSTVENLRSWIAELFSTEDFRPESLTDAMDNFMKGLGLS